MNSRLESEDFSYQQQQLEEERFFMLLTVLQRVKRGTSTEADALFLASELGLTSEFQRTSKGEQLCRA